MSRLLAAIFALFLMLCPALHAAVTVTSDPPGASVSWSVSDQPQVHLAGGTPVSLPIPSGSPWTLCVRKDGYWPAWRNLTSADTGPVAVKLRPLTGDFGALACIDVAQGRFGRVTSPDEAWNIPGFGDLAGSECRWSPDGRYAIWSRTLMGWSVGLAPPGPTAAGTPMPPPGAGDGGDTSVLTLLEPFSRIARDLIRFAYSSEFRSYSFNVDWSPHGQYLLYSTQPESVFGDEIIRIARIADRKPYAVIAEKGVSLYMPAATGTGNIGYIRDPGNTGRDGLQMWTCDWHGNNRRLLGPSGQANPCGTVDGWLVWAHGDRVLAWKDGKTQEILKRKHAPILGMAAEPAGNRVLIVLGSGLRENAFIWAPGMKTARRLPGVSGDLNWLPGGRLLAGGSIIDTSGRTLAALPPRKNPEFYLIGWSGDGRWLALADWQSGNGEGGTWAVPLDGADPVSIIPEKVYPRSFTWGPDARFAYVEEQLPKAPPALGVLVAAYPGAPLQRLLPRLKVTYASWSPDGDRLACVIGEPDHTRVAVVGYPGGAVTYLTDPGLWSSAVWHPTDPNRIAFSQEHDHGAGCGSTSYGIMDAQGKMVLQSAQTFVHAGAPRWTPDGDLNIGEDWLQKLTASGPAQNARFASRFAWEEWDHTVNDYAERTGTAVWSRDGRVAASDRGVVFVFSGRDVASRLVTDYYQAQVARDARPLQTLRPLQPAPVLLGIPAPQPWPLK